MEKVDRANVPLYTTLHFTYTTNILVHLPWHHVCTVVWNANYTTCSWLCPYHECTKFNWQCN